MKGRGLSQVQEFGLELLERQDNLRKAEERRLRQRYAMLSSGWYDPQALFPEWFEPQGETLQVTEDTPEDIFTRDDVDYDYSGVTWQSPSEMDQDELAMLEEAMADNSNVSVEVDDDPAWRGW